MDVRIFIRECCCLAKAGYDVHLVISADRPSVKHGVQIHPLKRPRSRLLRMLWMPWVALRTALKTKADIYHYHDPELLPVGFVLRWILRQRVVYDIHESNRRLILSKPYLSPFLARMAAAAFRWCERCLIAGQALIVANKNCLADYPRRAYLVQNFPLLDPCLKISSRPFDAQELPLLVYVGGVWPTAGSELYVDLAKALAQKGRAFEMQIVGPCTEAHMEHLKHRVAAAGLEGCVHIGGRRDWYEAMELVSRATIGLCLLMPIPNYTTCLATKIVEYMMMGTPVLASNFDAWRELVEGEQVGRMADPTDLDNVLRVCEGMLDDRAQLSAMSQRAIEAVRSKYNWQTEFEQLLVCYQQLMSGS